jgi:hypothetical protein
MPPALEAYSTAINDLFESRGKQPIEPIFEQGMKAAPQIRSDKSSFRFNCRA